MLAQPQRRGNGGGPPDPAQMVAWRVNFLADQLGLNNDQKAQATTIFTNAQTAAQAVFSDMQSLNTNMATAVKNNDAAQIDQLAASIGAAQGKAVAINAKADAAFYATLNADQKAKYDAMPRGGPGMGMGGMGMGGPMRGGQGAGRMRPPEQ
jgi:hypothetical protein